MIKIAAYILIFPVDIPPYYGSAWIEQWLNYKYQGCQRAWEAAPVSQFANHWPMQTQTTWQYNHNYIQENCDHVQRVSDNQWSMAVLNWMQHIQSVQLNSPASMHSLAQSAVQARACQKYPKTWTHAKSLSSSTYNNFLYIYGTTCHIKDQTFLCTM